MKFHLLVLFALIMKNSIAEEYYETFKGDLQVEIYNTMERLRAWAKLQGNMGGLIVRSEAKKKRATCEFTAK